MESLGENSRETWTHTWLDRTLICDFKEVHNIGSLLYYLGGRNTQLPCSQHHVQIFMPSGCLSAAEKGEGPFKAKDSLGRGTEDPGVSWGWVSMLGAVCKEMVMAGKENEQNMLIFARSLKAERQWECSRKCSSQLFSRGWVKCVHL